MLEAPPFWSGSLLVHEFELVSIDLNTKGRNRRHYKNKVSELIGGEAAGTVFTCVFPSAFVTEVILDLSLHVPRSANKCVICSHIYPQVREARTLLDSIESPSRSDHASPPSYYEHIRMRGNRKPAIAMKGQCHVSQLCSEVRLLPVFRHQAYLLHVRGSVSICSDS